MKKKRFLSVVMALVMLFGMTIGIQTVSAAVPSTVPEASPESNFTFDGAGTITGYTGTGGTVVIPSTIGGVSVTTIGMKAFHNQQPDTYNVKAITSVVIPDSVTTIGFGAFGNRNKIVSITIPGSVTSIDDYAFYMGYGKGSLSSAYFLGTSAVTLGTGVFGNAQANFKIFYESGKDGFSDTTSGYPSVSFNTASTYALTYDGNGNYGGSVPVSYSAKTAENIAVSGNTGSLVKIGYQFNGWSTSADGTSGTNYASGGVLIMGTEPVTLYARWDKIYTISKNVTGNGSITIKNSGNEIDYVLESAYGYGVIYPTVTVTPDQGWEYIIGTLKYNDGTTDNEIGTDEGGAFVFQMPKANIIVSAKFKHSSPLTVGTGGNYATLAGALAEAVDGDTIMLLNDITESVSYAVVADKTITIDGQNKTLKGVDGDVPDALTLTGQGSIKLKNITLQGGAGTETSYYGHGLNTIPSSNVNVLSEGSVNVIGGAAINSCAVRNQGAGTVNVTTATSNLTKTGYGVVNSGAGTVNVKTVNGNNGVANTGAGTVNVTTVSASAITVSNGSGTVNVTTANSTSGGGINNISGTVNVANNTGSITGTVNTDVATLILNKGPAASCVLDFITVAATGNTTVGTLPSVYKNGVLGVWFTDSAKTAPFNATTVTATTTLYSNFSNTVTFDKNGGDSLANPTAKTALSDGTIGSLPTAPARAGYTFNGWNTAANGSGTSFTGTTTVTGDITVYAQWTAKQPHSGGGGGGGGTTVTGSVIDGKGAQVSNLTATVTTDSNGNNSVAMKAAPTVTLQQPDGTKSSLSDLSKVTFRTAAGSPVTVSADGTINLTNLAKGTDNHFKITYDLGKGETITIGTMDVVVSSSGAVSLTSTLIDPYGVIIDAATGKLIVGANVTLYYANTDRNKTNGKTPDTVVPLPGIEGFKPNNNINPQISDASGAYGFMVFPTTDYYIVATKDGYNNYTSPTISVEQDIVKWDFKMNQPTPGVTRLAGLSRVDTALEIAKANYTGKVANVILATAENYPDALAGSVLAYKLNAPILLVGSTDADQEKVLAYMKSNLDSTGTVYILGGTAVVSSVMEGKVTASGFANTTRLAGNDRYDTSVKIAEQLKVKTGTPIVLAYGENYPDALSISSIAAEMQYPILLVQKDGLSDAVKNEIAAIKPTKVYIIGGQGVISTAVENQVAQITSLAKANIVRIAGVDRYETSLAVAQYFNIPGQSVCIATGNNFPDALAGSVYAANHNASIILADGNLSDQVKNYLKSKKLTGATLFGGDAVVSKDIEQQLGQLIGK